MKFREKPVVIEAFQLPPNIVEDASEELVSFLAESEFDIWTEGGVVRINTLEGVMIGNPGDWIIRGVAGEYYPCKPDIFEATYEPVEELTSTITDEDVERGVAAWVKPKGYPTDTKRWIRDVLTAYVEGKDNAI